MSDQRSLPIGDRDEPTESPRPGEKPSEFVERLATRDYTAPAPAAARRTCGCKERGWAEQHEEPFERHLERLFRRGDRAPGEDDA